MWEPTPNLDSGDKLCTFKTVKNQTNKQIYSEFGTVQNIVLTFAYFDSFTVSTEFGEYLN